MKWKNIYPSSVIMFQQPPLEKIKKQVISVYQWLTNCSWWISYIHHRKIIKKEGIKILCLCCSLYHLFRPSNKMEIFVMFLHTSTKHIKIHTQHITYVELMYVWCGRQLSFSSTEKVFEYSDRNPLCSDVFVYFNNAMNNF